MFSGINDLFRSNISASDVRVNANTKMITAQDKDWYSSQIGRVMGVGIKNDVILLHLFRIT